MPRTTRSQIEQRIKEMLSETIEGRDSESILETDVIQEYEYRTSRHVASWMLGFIIFLEELEYEFSVDILSSPETINTVGDLISVIISQIPLSDRIVD